MARPREPTQGTAQFLSLPVILDQARTEHASEAPISAPSDLEAPDRAGSTPDRYTDARLAVPILLFSPNPLSMSELPLKSMVNGPTATLTTRDHRLRSMPTTRPIRPCLSSAAPSDSAAAI